MMSNKTRWVFCAFFIILLFSFLNLSFAEEKEKLCETTLNDPNIAEPKSFVELADLISKSNMLVVLFRADWCDTCCAFTPVFKSMAERNKGKGVTFAVFEHKTVGDEDMTSAMGLAGTPYFTSLGLFVDGHSEGWIYAPNFYIQGEIQQGKGGGDKVLDIIVSSMIEFRNSKNKK